MPVDLTGAQEDLLTTAKERLTFGPAPNWVRSCPIRPDFKAKQSGHQTYLLVDRQINAESRQSFVHIALRLETLQGVHRHSQWRVDFDPAAQSVCIHSVMVHRGNLHQERAKPDSFHIVNRDSGADHVDTEGIAALSLLEDIRPGDILEWSYTIHEPAPILPQYATAMFTAPPGAPVGRLQFAIRFHQSMAMKWKSSSEDFFPDEAFEQSQNVWTWTRENHPGSLPEDNTPEWFIDYPWVQVSDCPDWESISTALAGAWQDDAPDPALAEIARKIARDHDNVPRQIEEAIQFVQDEFRVLPADTASFLQRPASSGLVLRRRFGDSKDLAFLLCRLLQRLQVTARPILVNRVWRQSIASLLPMPLFDHAVVEYQVRGETRWVDPTAKRQGGGSLNRVIRDFGAGLPVSPSSPLADAPDTAAQNSLYELRELILLDTSGAPSWLSITITARGSQAEELRREFEADGAAAVARKRFQQCVARFNTVRRIGEMEYRDDRAANVFLLAEGFEISGFLSNDAKPGLCKLTIPNDYLAGVLKMPDLETRRTPFALPFPSNIVHTIEVHCVALPPGILQTREIESPFINFSRFRKSLAGDWTTKYTISTLTDAIPADQVEPYRNTLRDIRAEASWSLLAPVGQPRPHQRGDFGKIPESWEKASQQNAPAVALPFRLPERRAAIAPASTHAIPAAASSAPEGVSGGGRAREMLPGELVEHTSHGANGSNGSNGSNGAGSSTSDNGSDAVAAPVPGAPVVRLKRRRRHRRRRKVEETKLTLRAWGLIFVAALIGVIFIWLFARGNGPTLPKIDPPADVGN